MSSFLPESIDVAAGLVFVYLFMSALATIGREALEGFIKSRARNLEKGLIELLCDQPQDKSGKAKNAAYDLLKGFYEHPLVMTLYRGKYTIPPKRNFSQGRRLPSYIPSDHFAYVVLDMLAEKGGQISGSLDPQSILAAAENLDNRRLAKMVQFAIHNSGGDVDKARQFLQTWFDATMDRVSGWYRLETQTILFWISLFACIVLNVNTVVIADSLWRSPSLRKTVELQAEAYYRANPDKITAMPQGGVTDPADTAAANAAPAADTVPDVTVPVTPISLPAPQPLPDPISAKATFKASADVPGQINPTDPLEKLGLPLGWNKETITAMHRLFPTPPRAVDDHQKRVELQEQIEAHKATGVSGEAAKPTLIDWFHNQFRRIEAFWADVRDAYDEGGQDPTKNALFTAAGTLSLFMGWVMTAFAVTLGAPFWFDVLGKLMMVRSTLKPGQGGGAPPSNLESALVAAFAPPANGGTGGTPALLPYKPGSGVSAAAAPGGAGDNVNGIDPNDRPRDA
jgi:hypothetical protein